MHIAIIRQVLLIRKISEANKIGLYPGSEVLMDYLDREMELRGFREKAGKTLITFRRDISAIKKLGRVNTNFILKPQQSEQSI